MAYGIEGSRTPYPTRWDNDYLVNLFKFDWKKIESPAGSLQWTPIDPYAPKALEVPGVSLPWQDPIPPREHVLREHALIDESDISRLKQQILDSGLSVSSLVSIAWASAYTYRDNDKRGGPSGARIRLAPQKDWAVNILPQLSQTLEALKAVQQDFDAAQSNDKQCLWRI